MTGGGQRGLNVETKKADSRRLLYCRQRLFTLQLEQLQQVQLQLVLIQQLEQMLEQMLLQQQQLLVLQQQQLALQQQQVQQLLRRKQSKSEPTKQQQEQIISWLISLCFVDKRFDRFALQQKTKSRHSTSKFEKI